jgi:hypothetical protein
VPQFFIEYFLRLVKEANGQMIAVLAPTIDESDIKKDGSSSLGELTNVFLDRLAHLQKKHNIVIKLAVPIKSYEPKENKADLSRAAFFGKPVDAIANYTTQHSQMWMLPREGLEVFGIPYYMHATSVEACRWKPGISDLALAPHINRESAFVFSKATSLRITPGNQNSSIKQSFADVGFSSTSQ